MIRNTHRFSGDFNRYSPRGEPGFPFYLNEQTNKPENSSLLGEPPIMQIKTSEHPSLFTSASLLHQQQAFGIQPPFSPFSSPVVPSFYTYPEFLGFSLLHSSDPGSNRQFSSIHPVFIHRPVPVIENSVFPSFSVVQPHQGSFPSDHSGNTAFTQPPYRAHSSFIEENIATANNLPGTRTNTFCPLLRRGLETDPQQLNSLHTTQKEVTSKESLSSSSIHKRSRNRYRRRKTLLHL